MEVIDCVEVPSSGPDKVALLMPAFPMSLADASLTLPPLPTVIGEVIGEARDVLALNVSLCGICTVQAFACAGLAHGDIKPANFMLETSGTVICIDFGTAQNVGESFLEASNFSLNQPRAASSLYDIVSLGATIASLYDVSISPGATIDRTLTALRAVMARAGTPPLAMRIAELCLTSHDLSEIQRFIEETQHPELSLNTVVNFRSLCPPE
mmetsp:Transcript_13305/g.31403  ORF Transcript_13305/g.31403 Transcript_13305/m.31403 type:complete len:211 (-) Transcript_13305:211-843(-)